VRQQELQDAVLQEQRPKVRSALVQIEVMQLAHLPCEFFRRFQFRERLQD
jgi:hypothetical protein